MTTTTLKTIGLVSPTRREEYTLLDVLKKAMDRADVGIHLTRQLLFQTAYGDMDYLLHFHLKIGPSVWSDSIYGEISFTMPAHYRMSGVFDGFQWGCGEAYDQKAPDHYEKIKFSGEYDLKLGWEGEPKKSRGFLSHEDIAEIPSGILHKIFHRFLETRWVSEDSMIKRIYP